ncbi:MAG: outer membrane efflux protein [uncultured bacterium]|nr:MAG: outer membrane efflux protein [uncultured bacterium]
MIAMSMKRFSLLIISFLLFLPSRALAAPPQYRLNLSDCIEMAVRNNEEIKAQEYDVQAYIARKIEATKRYVPVVTIKYRMAPVPRDLNNPAVSFLSGDISVFNSIKLEAGIPITTFGRIEVNKHLAEIGIDAAQLKTKQKTDEVILDIHKLYHGILLARELKVLANKGLDAIHEKIAELEKEENIDQLQILKLKAVYYEVEKRLDEAHKKETIALAMLKVRTGIGDDVDFDIKDKALTTDYLAIEAYENLLQTSKAKRPEFQLLQHQVNAKNLQVKLEKKAYFPMLKFGGYFEYGNSPHIIGDEDDNTFNNPFNYTRAAAGLELSNELDFRKIQANVEKAKAEHLKAIAEKRSNDRLLEVDLKNAYLDFIQKQKFLSRAEKEQRAAREIVFLTKSNLDIGLGEKKEYLDALQSYLVIQAAVLENIYNYNMAAATLKQKLGTIGQEARTKAL